MNPITESPRLWQRGTCLRRVPERLIIWRRLCIAWLVPALSLLCAACARVPSGSEFRDTQALLPSPRPGVQADARADFRQLMCALADRQQPAAHDCDQLLWRLADEGAADGARALPALDKELRVFVVGGAFSDCFGSASQAYGEAVATLAGRGYRVYQLAISGRSGSAYNARMIAEGLRSPPQLSTGKTLLIGYSKGVIDILEFLVSYPELAQQVDAVASIGGPVQGSQVASSGVWPYDTLLAGAFAGRCPPGDGGVVDSLLPARRQQWLAENELPAHVRYYVLQAFTTGERIALALKPSWQLLAETDARNDGQVALEEGVIPGSTLLGYVNTDHWGLAIDIESALPTLAARDDPEPYPRSLLFEALLRYVATDLGIAGSVQ